MCVGSLTIISREKTNESWQSMYMLKLTSEYYRSLFFTEQRENPSEPTVHLLHPVPEGLHFLIAYSFTFLGWVLQLSDRNVIHLLLFKTAQNTFPPLCNKVKLSDLPLFSFGVGNLYFSI